MDLKLSRRKALLGTPLLLGSSQAAADPAHVARAFAMRDKAVAEGDQPYGAIVVRGADILAEMPSRVVVNGDPTAHAEMEAIRAAAKAWAAATFRARCSSPRRGPAPCARPPPIGPASAA